MLSDERLGTHFDRLRSPMTSELCKRWIRTVPSGTLSVASREHGLIVTMPGEEPFVIPGAVRGKRYETLEQFIKDDLERYGSE